MSSATDIRRSAGIGLIAGSDARPPPASGVERAGRPFVSFLTICARDRCFAHGVAIRTMSSTDEANLSCADCDCPFGPYPLGLGACPCLFLRRDTIRVREVLAAHPVLMRERSATR
jgi:hypothetical protein